MPGDSTLIIKEYKSQEFFYKCLIYLIVFSTHEILTLLHSFADPLGITQLPGPGSRSGNWGRDRKRKLLGERF
jgi:hypothetical protein